MAIEAPKRRNTMPTNSAQPPWNITYLAVTENKTLVSIIPTILEDPSASLMQRALLSLLILT